MSSIIIKFKDAKIYKYFSINFPNNISKEKEFTFEFTNENIKNITSLSLCNLDIENIDGLENFSYLSELNLGNNKIKDISKIALLLRLKKLELYGNKISDLLPLKTLTEIKYLDISRNKIK